MKLQLIHLFMLFLFFLIVAPFVNPLVEGMAGMRSIDEDEKTDTEGTETVEETVENEDYGKLDPDSYMLKSQMVPPVCPACPQTCDKEREKPCPPCPPCARCPEPAFDCKKVPNYDVNTKEINDKYLPKPILTDFSGFGN